jgi:peptidoglycan/LPS O-acetylase OafA/YrhL
MIVASSLPKARVSIANPIPYLVLMGAFLGVGGLIARFVSFYAGEMQPADNVRFEALDGLRGLLAFGVFFHHVRFTYQYYNTGAWEAPEQGLYHVLGPLSVAFFFAITAFLFWGKALSAKGKVDPLRLYENRVRRIGPMYMVSLGVIGTILFLLAHFRFTAPLPHLAGRSALSLCLGFFGLPQDTINHVPVNMVNASVYWTLQYEWAFYLALPLLARVLQRDWIFVAFVLAFTLLAIMKPAMRMARLSPFILGMCAARLFAWREMPALRSAPVTLASVAAILLVPFAMGSYASPSGASNWTPIASLVIALPFLAVVHGNNFFRLLTLPGAKVLGRISYSVYLLHGIVLFVTMRCLNAYFPLHGMLPLVYWCFAGLSGLATLGLSALSYRWIEYPWLRGKRPKDLSSTPPRLATP